MEVVKDRVALVACAQDEVGAAIAKRLAEKGAKVIVSDSDKARVDALVSDIKAQGGQAAALVLDGADPSQVRDGVAKVLGEFGRVDILVNNHDIPNGSKIQDVTDDQWLEGLTANMSPTFHFCREILPNMCGNKYGRIVNVGNIECMGWPGKSNYSAAKSAVFGFTRSLALESAGDDVTVNCVVKGDLQTPGMSEEDVEKTAKRIPVKRLGQAADVARTVCFFASDTSKYVTGQTFFVCGGKSAYFSMSI